MEHKLKRGQALVLVGEQGSGKGTLARQIAAKHGSFLEIEVGQLAMPYSLGGVLENEPNTLIVDGLPHGPMVLGEVKAMLTNERVVCHRKGQNARVVKSPNFIFCTGSSDWLKANESDRRFFVVQVGKSAAMKAEE